jgi:5-methylcytosine-specific restriction endonuclease McrA
MNFEYPEDESYFRALLCRHSEELALYYRLFDLRPPKQKRAEFNRKMKDLRAELVRRHGEVCQLQLVEDCGLEHGLAVDHVIPLSSNKLNKELRHIAAQPGKKVPSQSFGSNDLSNLALACGRCNGYKKHRFLDPAHIRRILSRKGAP